MDNASIIRNTINEIPRVEGPVAVTEYSHPFCAMAYSREPLDLEQYGYLEEEFFLSGTANVYDADENDLPVVARQGLPYKNRILVRRPKSGQDFSGRVYVDIMNATQGYDIEDLWHRNYLWCMEYGHAYVGITSKPVNVMSLKNFDYERYGELNWSNGELVPAPVISRTATIPGTEEGLFWDMLSQLGVLLRQDGENCLGGYRAEYIYLTGQSQSGAYLNTYVSYFDRYARRENGKSIYDGYMNIVGALVQRSIRQDKKIGNLRLSKRNMHPSSTPYICMSSEADLYLFNLFVEGNLLQMKIENTDTPEDKCRYYEIPGAPHTDIICPILSALGEIEQAGGKAPNLDPKLLENINDMHVEYYVCGLLEKLHRWAAYNEAPEVCMPLIREKGDLRRDVNGNAEGGLRSPYVDVPVAGYVASNPEDPEGICGVMTYFSREKVEELYGSAENYLQKFADYTDAQQREGWITETDAGKLKEWSREAVKKIFENDV
ncbi:MAG: alpha/beta hydrolase domain-containing protein [Eubacteriales bacterium]|nr:alpha/beta hydrolase domain-containing protein [Eubacteriales bacterium]